MIKPETLKHRLRVYLCRKMSLKNSINYLYYIQLDLCTKPNRSNLLRVKKKNIVDGIRSLFFFTLEQYQYVCHHWTHAKYCRRNGERFYSMQSCAAGVSVCVCTSVCVCVRVYVWFNIRERIVVFDSSVYQTQNRASLHNRHQSVHQIRVRCSVSVPPLCLLFRLRCRVVRI